jgi:ABC-type uncharacterized transport system permease subunit
VVVVMMCVLNFVISVAFLLTENGLAVEALSLNKALTALVGISN